MEKEADEFASALLMPRRDIASELRGLTLEKAAYMKPVWRVSMASIIYRASKLELIDKNKSEYIWRQMSAKNFRLREPASLDFSPEESSLMNALVSNLVDELQYSENDMVAALKLYYEELAMMYGLKRSSPLRRVK